MITVVTPTYNRAYILTKCYESLCNQSNMNFVWLVIDDGSTDNTEEVVKKWISENKIEIIYHKKENGGKASALNIAISMLKTEYAVCLDSDDIFYPDTVALSLKQLKSIQNDTQCCGILALRSNPNGTVMGGKNIPTNMKTITAEDVLLKLNLKTELICFYKTEILKQYRFPEFEGEKFVPPSWMLYSITQSYYFCTSWDKLCCCEYVEDGLTKNKKKVIVKNPKGYTCVKRFSYALSPTLKLKIKHGIMYEYGCILCGEKGIKNSPHRFLSVLLRPIGWLVYYQRKNIS